MPDQYTLEHFRRRELAPDRPAAGDGRDRPGLQPPPVGAAAASWCRGTRSATARSSTGCPSRARRRRTVVERPRDGRAALRRVDRVLLADAHLVPRRPTPTPTWCWSSLGDHQPHSYVSGEDAGHDVPITRDRPGPGRDASGSPAGTGRPACAPRRTPRSGGWTRSATGSSRRSVRAAERPALSAALAQHRRPVDGLDLDVSMSSGATDVAIVTCISLAGHGLPASRPARRRRRSVWTNIVYVGQPCRSRRRLS